MNMLYVFKLIFKFHIKVNITNLITISVWSVCGMLIAHVQLSILI